MIDGFSKLSSPLLRSSQSQLDKRVHFRLAKVAKGSSIDYCTRTGGWTFFLSMRLKNDRRLREITTSTIYRVNIFVFITKIMCNCDSLIYPNKRTTGISSGNM